MALYIPYRCPKCFESVRLIQPQHKGGGFKGPAKGQCLNCMDELEYDLRVPANRRDTTYRRSMFDFFANNIILFLSSYFVAAVSWILSSRLPRKRMRRAVRASILYLVFPVFFLGHPFMLFQFWMFVVAGIVLMDFKWIMTMLIIWTVLLMVSTHNVET